MHRIHHHEETARERFVLDLDEIARRGAQKMLASALEAEVETYLRAARSERDEQGRALVVRNGYARSREVVCGAGNIEVRAPRVNDKRVDDQTGGRKRFKEHDPASVHAPLAEGYGGLAAAVLARALQRGLHAGPAGVLRHRGRAIPG